MEEILKIKPLTKEQILISLDRLTRFKQPEDKYLRVFKELISSNLISPKFKKKELESMNYKELTNLVEKIFKQSLSSFEINPSKDFSLNKFFLKHEKTLFKFNKEVEMLINNKIDYKNASKLVAFKAKCLKHPIKKLVLTEGITEEILLPKFTKILGHDLEKSGIKLISAGGKKQVVRLFYKYADTLKIPMFVLLDNDGAENFKELEPKLRKNDTVHVINCGEFEDLLPLNLIKRALNKQFKDTKAVVIKDLTKNLPMTKILEEIFKSRGLEFKKAEFASLISQNIKNSKDISSELQELIKKIIR